MPHALLLVGSCCAMVLLYLIVGARLLQVRAREMREKRVHPQAAATSVQMAAKLQNVQAADNFRNLFEVPVLFFALVATAIATTHTPQWLVIGAWFFVALRYAHSFIHCTYNKVMHRFPVFGAGFLLIVGLWIAFFFSLLARAA